MMTQSGMFPIYRGNTFDLLEKPYVSPEGRNLSQVIFLPHSPNGLVKMEKDLSDEAIAQFRKSAQQQKVDLSMPKINMESTFQLLDILKDMGLPLDAIDPELILSQPASLNNVIQKTVVKTDEEGSVAAAVTAVGYECLAVLDPEKPNVFNIDHSYAYFIMDGDKVLFRGRVADATPLVVD